ncbi:MAG: hypothetical protein WCO12_03665 [bacterium]
MKKIITIIVIIFLIALAGIGYFVFTNTNQKTINPGTVFDNVKNFFPFGKPDTQTETQVSTSTDSNNNTQQAPQLKVTERMFQISSAPTAGYVAFDVISTSTLSSLSFGTSTFSTTSTSTKKINTSASSTKQTDTIVRFLERITGHVYEVKIPTLEKKQVSNTTYSKVYDAKFNSNGSEVIVRQLNNENISTNYIKLSTSTQNTNRSYPNNTDILITKKDSVFYTIKSQNGSVGYISTFDNKKPTQIFSTPLRDILAEWSGGDIVAIFPKPHSDYPGVLSFVDTKKGTSKQVLSGVNGLTALPNSDATYFIYNTNSKNLSLDAQKVSSITDISLQTKTLPEKCVWSKKNPKLIYCAASSFPQENGYPEKWYQGVVSFNDSIWQINVETGEEKILYNPIADGKDNPDMTNLMLNDKENYLFFINKKDLTLWGLSL